MNVVLKFAGVLYKDTYKQRNTTNVYHHVKIFYVILLYIMTTLTNSEGNVFFYTNELIEKFYYS